MKQCTTCRAHIKLFGNGEKGLVDIVGEHEEFYQRFKGALWFMGFTGLSNIAALIAFFTKA